MSEAHPLPPHQTAVESDGAARRGPLLVTAVFVVACVLFRSLFTIEDDEGQLSYIGAHLVLKEPLAALFFQKIRPFMSLVYAPFTAGGERLYIGVHIAFAALGVWLAGRIAQRAGGVGWIAAAVVAANPVYLLVAVSGESNTDAIVGLVGGTLLLFQPGASLRMLGGLVLGATPWVRYESSPAVAILGLYVLYRRDWRAVLGFAIWPLLYLSGGALYHRDPLWFLHFAPTLSEAPRELAGQHPLPGGSEGGGAALTEVLICAGAACAAWPLALSSRLRDVAGPGRALVAGLFLLVPLMFGMPFFGVMTFELQARYQMVILPAMAVASSAVIVHATRQTRARAAIIGVLLIVATVATGLVLGWMKAVAPIFVGAALLLPTLRSRCIAVIAALGVYVIAFSFAPDVHRRFVNPLPAEETESFQRFLEENREAMRKHVVYTTHPQIGLMSRRLGQPVRFVLTPEMIYELHATTNHQNGQFDRLMRALGPEFYGGPFWPCQLPQVPLEPGDVIIARIEKFASLVFPPEMQQLGTVVSNEGDPMLAIRIGPNPVRLHDSDVPMSSWGDVYRAPCRAIAQSESKP